MQSFSDVIFNELTLRVEAEEQQFLQSLIVEPEKEFFDWTLTQRKFFFFFRGSDWCSVVWPASIP